MINIAQCEFDSDRLSVSGIKALKEIIDIVDRANLLAKVVSIIPFFDIFLGGKTHKKLTNVASYDWEEFSKVMQSVSNINRVKIYNIATEQWLESSGKEYEFWRCVSENTR